MEYISNIEELWQKYWKARKGSDITLIREYRDDLTCYYAGSKNGLVEIIAKNVLSRLCLNMELLEDIIQESIYSSQNKNGNNDQNGLIYAIEHYDPSFGIPFNYYAQRFIKWAMYHGNTIRNYLSADQIKSSNSFRKITTAFIEEFGHTPSYSELSIYCGKKIENIRTMEQAYITSEPVSIEELIDQYRNYYDSEIDFSDENAQNPEQTLIDEEDEEKNILNLMLTG